ncbi:MAG: hypothetical protein Q7W45_02735 [Bacteroidota bacterium]|nr:hypothetical protein [Bacteroidota bacterium]MDP3145830.1 hypothetical protein [Bacteroidota bacterium]
MESTINLKSGQTASYSTKNVSAQRELSAYGKLIQKLEFSYFGLISMTILIGSIIAGIAASVVLDNNAPIWQLCTIAAIAMANNTSGIAQAPTKWVVGTFILNAAVSTIFILANL